MFSYAIIIVVVSYLIGSVPYGLVIIKIFKKIDLREHGSKNIGATNALRIGGFKLGLFTLILDVSKGGIAVIIFKYLFHNQDYDLSLLAGFFALMGHLFPIWLKFKGGKGVATAFGVILATNPLIGILSLSTWLCIAFAFKYSSLSAIITFALLPFYFYFLDASKIYYAIIISIIVVLKHKDNIMRLIKGQESKIKLKK